MTTKNSICNIKPSPSRISPKNNPATVTTRILPPILSDATKSLKLAAKSPGKTVSPTTAEALLVPANPARDSKQARLITMLRSKRGATIDQMMVMTGWQAHTVRGTISRVLRKRLRLIVACKSSTAAGENLYRIVGSASGL